MIAKRILVLAVMALMPAGPSSAAPQRAPKRTPSAPERAAPPPNGDFALPSESEILERVRIAVPGSTPRTFIYTNKKAAFFAGETSSLNKDPNQGLNVYGRKVLEDYRIAVDGSPLGRASAVSTDVYPQALVRHYAGGLDEEVSMLDGVDAIVVTVRSPRRAVRASIEPVVAGVLRPGDCETSADEARGRLTVVPRFGGDFEQQTPRAIAVFAAAAKGAPACGTAATVVAAPVARAAASETTPKTSSKASSRPRAKEPFSPGAVSSACAARETRFVVAVGRDRADADRLADRLATEAGALIEGRRSRIARLLLDTYVETADPRFDRALAWLKASGDALVTDQAGPGIWAGLYWFDNYWGRDTFVSLPGIRLVTGQYDDARRILESFAKYQKTDANDPLYGRVPNRVNSPTDVIYNTADGTPWFVREAYEYVLYSGDRAFAREIYPAVKRATDGALRYHVDADGLLTHPDADTWMDAQWEGKTPWSPRGNRAIDVEALWCAQLEASAALAEMTGDAASASAWQSAATRAADSVARLFRDPATGTLYDHLNADGTPDRQVRPNEIFALTVPFTPILMQDEGVPVVRQVVTELTYPYGVASLSQRDPDFHPYHHDERWHYDAAYHNGTVWGWNAGPVVTALVQYGQQDFAYRLTRALADQALDAGTVGTLSELVDAIPRGGKIRLSGTETQAWSVAEFVRNFYQDYLGVRPNAVAGELSIVPNLPRALGAVRAVVPYGAERIKVTIEPRPDGRARMLLFAPKGKGVIVSTPLDAESEAASEDSRLLLGDRTLALALAAPPPPNPELGALRFATPTIAPGLKALAANATPVHRATADEVAVPEPAGARVLYEADDPEGDDTGPNGRYTYPTDAHYEPGILDVTHVRVAADDNRYYFTVRFRRLVDPGWHPELGFQLTYLAVAIDADGVAGTGATEVGKSAAYRLPANFGFEKIVYVGGALELDDASGTPLLTYSPASRDGALGDAAEGVVRFSLSRAVLGDATPAWRFAVVAGAQDDGGAAGLGVFRAVRRAGGQWVGGGADSDDGAPRVYDAVLP